MKNKTVRDAVNRFKGKWIFSLKHLCYTVEDGEYFAIDSLTSTNNSEFFVCTRGQFNDEVESMSHHAGKELFQQYLAADKTLLEKETKVDYKSEEFWKDAPEGTTHYNPSKYAELCKYYNLDGDDYYYYFKGEWCLSTSSQKALNEQLIPRPQPKPVFTQEMSGNGELIEVGMMVIISDEYSDVWGDSLHLVECPVQVMAVFDGLGIELGKSIPMVSVSNKGGSSACFRADMCKPLTPPIELIDGKEYKFMYRHKRGLGFYNERLNEFSSLNHTIDIEHCTNIKPLTVEVAK